LDRYGLRLEWFNETRKASYEIGLLKKGRGPEYDHDARQAMEAKPISNLKANFGL
jgi:hypothetical protein